MSASHPGTNTPHPTAFNIKQACAYVGLSRSSIYKLFEAGRLQRIKVGKRVLILRKQLDELLQNSTV